MMRCLQCTFERAGAALLTAMVAVFVAIAASLSCKPAYAQQDNRLPSAEETLILIRTTLLTLNDAMRTGNFTVLRDVASPRFQAKISAAELGTAFAHLVKRQVDLSAAAILTPQLSIAPRLAKEGLLLQGHLPSKPLQIDFQLLFTRVDTTWRIEGLTVAVQNVGTTAGAPAPPEPLPKRSKLEGKKK